MKRKILLPLMAISFSLPSFAGECDYVIDAYKDRGRKTFHDLTVVEKDALNSCLADNPEAEKSSAYKNFQSKTQAFDKESEEARKKDAHEKEVLAGRQSKVFGTKELNNYGLPLFAVKVEHLWASEDKGYRHSKIVRLTDANDYCKKQGYQRAGQVVIEAKANKGNEADKLSAQGTIIEDIWYKMGNKKTPFKYDEDDYDQRKEFRKPHVLKFNSIECIKNSYKEDKLDDIVTVSTFKDELGNEQRLLLDEKEHELNELFGNFMMGNERADSREQEEVFNEDRNCKNGKKLGVNYSYCSYGYKEVSFDEDESSKETGVDNSSYMPSTRLKDRFNEIDKRYNSGATR